MKNLLLAISFVALVASCAVLADENEGVLGGYQNDADGTTYLLSEQGPCSNGLRMAAAQNAAGAIVAAGCYGVHGSTVFILWLRGPATVVPVARVTWKQPAPPPVAPVTS